MAKKRFDPESYLRKYATEFPRLRDLAERVQSFAASALAEAYFPVHLVSARPKGAESVREKIQRKGYRNPGRQLTDKIGLRIITYYRDDVDKVAEILRSRFEVNPKKSVDKRTALGLTSFGYRSVHLIARVREKKLPLEYADLKGVWCEIQVRSLLEHAWAEIEHEIVYKSGVSYPKHFSRQFAALAGALEILDSEFLSLRGQRNVLIDVHKSAYRERLEGRKRLDSARLLGFLECEYPDGLGWRKAEERGQPFKTHSDAICVNALQSAGIVTADSMKKVLRSKPYQKLVRAFADQQQLARTEISHFAVVLMALATRGPRLVELFFPDVVQDPGISAALALARKKK